MSKQYKIGLVIEGDGQGGIKAIQATEGALEKLEKQTKQNEKAQKELGDEAGGLSSKMGGVLAAGAAAATAAIAGLASTLRFEAITEIKKTADFLNMSTEALSTWTYAAKSVGLEADKVGDIFKDVQDKIGDFVATGGGEAKDIFDNLGLSVKDLKNLKPDEQLIKIAEGLEKVGTNGEKIFYMESLADEASRLLPLLENGAAGLKKMQREAELLGVALTDVEVEQVAMASTEFGRLGTAAEGFANQLTIQLSGAFANSSKGLMDFLEDMGGMKKVVANVVEFGVNRIADFIDVIHMIRIPLKQSEIGWRYLGDLVAEVLADNAETVAWFGNKVLGFLLDKLGSVLDYIAEANEFLAEYLGESGQRFADFATKLRETAESARNYEFTAEGVREAQVRMKEATKQAEAELQALRKSAPGEEFRENFKKSQEAVEAQAKAVVESKKAHEDLGKAATAMTYEQRKAQEDAAKATEKAAKEAEKAAEKAAKEAEKQAEQYAKAWEESVKRIDEAFADGWLDVIEGNASNVFDNILDGFKRMLAEMAHQAITRPIMLSFMSSMGMGPQGGAGGLMSGLSSLGGMGGTANSAGGLMQTLGLTGLASSFGLMGSAATASATLLGAGQIGVAGNLAGNLFAGGHIMGGIGAALPMVAAAAAIAMGVDKLTGGGLFGTKFKETGRDLNLSLLGTQVSGNIVTEETKKKSLFRGKKRRYTTTDLDLDGMGFGDTFEGIADAAVYGADRLGFKNADSILSNFRDFTSISVKDKSEEEIQNLIAEWVKGTGDKMVGAVFGDAFASFKTEGESLVDAMIRVVNQLDFVSAGFDGVNISLEKLAGTTGIIQAQYADDVLNEAGGSDRLAQLLATYQKKYFSEEELLEKALGQLGGQLQAALSGIGFEYGDNFRAEFEAAQNSNLSAAKLVDWLEAGSMIAQFDELVSKLAELTGRTVEEVAQESLALSKTLAEQLKEAAKESEVKPGTPGTVTEGGQPGEGTTPDPIGERLEFLNETLRETNTANGETLNSIDSRLVEVNATLERSVQSFTAEVRDATRQTDGMVAAVTRAVVDLAAQVQGIASGTSTQIRDLARLIGDEKGRVYQPMPIFRPEPLF